MSISSEQAHRPWSMFFGWLLVGTLWMAGIASILSIGILVLAFLKIQISHRTFLLDWLEFFALKVRNILN